MEILKKLRADKGLSQAGLARLCDVSQTCISELEAGKKEPTLSTLKKLSAGLGKPISALLGETQEVQPVCQSYRPS